MNDNPIVEIAINKTRQFKINSLNKDDIEFIKNECDIISSYQLNELDNTINYSIRFYKFDLKEFNYYPYNTWLSTSVIQAFINAIDSKCDYIEFILEED